MDTGTHHSLIGHLNEPVEISYGTCRSIRARQIGQIFILEQLQIKDGQERWMSIAKSEGPDARNEILAALNGANEQMERHFVAIRKRAARTPVT